jgi:hypothetical protein
MRPALLFLLTALALAQPNPAPPEDSITLERTTCFGFCPP